MSKISLGSRTDFNRSKFHWTAEIGAGHGTRAHQPLKNFSIASGTFPMMFYVSYLWYEV